VIVARVGLCQLPADVSTSCVLSWTAGITKVAHAQQTKELLANDWRGGGRRGAGSRLVFQSVATTKDIRAAIHPTITKQECNGAFEC